MYFSRIAPVSPTHTERSAGGLLVSGFVGFFPGVCAATERFCAVAYRAASSDDAMTTIHPTDERRFMGTSVAGFSKTMARNERAPTARAAPESTSAAAK